jgi:intein/homing endonuclease
LVYLNYSDRLYYAKVNRIIRHKVSKPKWKLKTKTGKEIIVTNDHSMIVFRNGVKIEVKPSQILKTDKILIIKED